MAARKPAFSAKFLLTRVSAYAILSNKFKYKGVDEERIGETDPQRAGGWCETGTLQFPRLSLLSRKEESVPWRARSRPFP